MKKINIFKINCQKIKILKIKHGATKNFAVVKPLNSGEALASLASPVPTPLHLISSKVMKAGLCNLQLA